MSSVLSAIDDKLAAWMEAQPVFFVATAPLSGSGHVNVSPKGMAGTFRVLGPHRVAYLDFHASGVETVAHLREPGNGRICVMFCAFDGRPQVVRIHGRGTVVRKDDPEFAELRRAFGKDRVVGQRAIIVIDADRLSDACGWAVPEMDFVADRTILDLHQEKKGAAAYVDYDETKNARSIDGLPAMTRHAEPGQPA
ncbi:pyridoxamine 5'-phosphate oxidase family protein [Solicola gregarius]|uniref:Pyridoxamine 5'-phosphate oxidase family protein n=1 Tax=Solicola gregarius TaxID=2908642 RepID=A0AA46TII0_9ACTN|nr:pyridoxamine 5'-phosphate oxidase family protein [Solicola gregarius]UYM05841.1 pyridoxamine 5'-phosphate oxidase family protein [Solicola gregarius]